MASLRTPVALAGLILCAVDMHAQGVLGGTVSDSERGRPLACLSVALVSAEDVVVAQARTRVDGTFDLPAPSAPGLYRLRFIGLGLEQVESDTLRLDATTDFEVPFRLALAWARGSFAGARSDHLGIDVAPRALVGGGSLKYPEQLLADSLDGRVVIGFAIDTAGRVDPRSAVVLLSSHPAFESAVRRALSAFRYSPAQYSGAPQCLFVVREFLFSNPRRP